MPTSTIDRVDQHRRPHRPAPATIARAGKPRAGQAGGRSAAAPGRAQVLLGLGQALGDPLTCSREAVARPVTGLGRALATARPSQGHGQGWRQAEPRAAGQAAGRGWPWASLGQALARLEADFRLRQASAPPWGRLGAGLGAGVGRLARALRRLEARSRQGCRAGALADG